MKKTLVSIVLGIALLALSGPASAEPDRHAEPQWSLRPERGTAPSPLDLARWLARRLLGTLDEPVLAPVEAPLPAPAPAMAPAPATPNEVCVPERGHCPWG